MELKLVLEFIKKYWVQSLIVILVATIFYLNISNSILESKLALAEQKLSQEQNKLTASNTSITELQTTISLQNQKLKQLGTNTQDNIEMSKKALQEAIKENEKLQEKLDNIKDVVYDNSKDECYNIKQVLKNVGE